MPLQSHPNQLPEIRGPLEERDARGITMFLKERPETPLRVVDCKSGEIGTLCIGIAGTVCATLGQDRLAIPCHPGRFELTAHSLTAYMAEVRRRAAAVANDAMDDDRISFYSDDEPATASAEAKDELSPEGRLKALLKDTLRRADAPRLSGADRAIQFNNCLDRTACDEICRLAQAAGATIETLPIRPKPSIGIYGSCITVLIGHLISYLQIQDMDGKLRSTDNTGTGPFAIVLQPAYGRMFIVNRSFWREML